MTCSCFAGVTGVAGAEIVTVAILLLRFEVLLFETEDNEKQADNFGERLFLWRHKQINSLDQSEVKSSR